MTSHFTIFNRIVENIEKVIIGKRRQIELAIVTLISRGHLLIEDVPGVGKTSLASALARSMNCSFRRIQFTPDIMPSDVAGFTMYDPKTGDFRYKPGAVFSNVVLADEINRTSPKTQSSLLEAMEERQVTVDGTTRFLPEPFIVLATQNPLDYLGTYPLPEAQMDRFFMRISLGYPSAEDEVRLISRANGGDTVKNLEPVIDAQDIIRVQNLLSQVYIEHSVSEYIVNMVRDTRSNPMTELGASPRAAIALSHAAQAWALYHGRNYVIPDDVIDMSVHVLAHRIIVTQEAKIKSYTGQNAVHEAITRTKLPLGG